MAQLVSKHCQCDLWQGPSGKSLFLKETNTPFPIILQQDMVLTKQALLPVAIAQIASFGLVTGRTDARQGCAHVSICNVSMEILVVLPERPWRLHAALRECALSFWRSAQWKVVLEAHQTLDSTCLSGG